MGAQAARNTESGIMDFNTFISRYREKLGVIFADENINLRMSLKRRIPDDVLQDIRSCQPLSVTIPSEYGGRGGHVHEFLSVLEESSYQSLALSLTFGINGALFLQPVARYADPAIKPGIFERFLAGRSLGGLMITEPDYGSDALSMQTSYSELDNSFNVKGIKHWAGLTGMADYWLLTARKRGSDGSLRRDIDFFVCDVTDSAQEIKVEELFNNLGLYPIQYGRNIIDVSVPKDQRLKPHSTGVKLMLDTLHRSRIEFPGMGMGFLKRLLDEGIKHCRERFVGGKSLFSYDQVKSRLSRLQAYYTTCSAMCAYSSETAGIGNDLSKHGLQANVVKSVLTDFMQSASQSLLQLVGAKGYKLEHIAGRSTVDSRPFQMFEGSNDILYQQISDSILKSMRKLKESNLYEYLSKSDLTGRAAEYLKDIVNFSPDAQMPQRKLVELGKMIGRIASMELVLKLGDRGFGPDLISNCITVLKEDVETISSRFRCRDLANVVEDYQEDSSWLRFVDVKAI